MTPIRLTAAALALACPLLTAAPATACTRPHPVANSSRSDWNIGSWTDSTCSTGHIHQITPGHHRTARSIKAYGKHNVLRRADGSKKTLHKRHRYTVTGTGWTVTSTGD